jgi:hypothetical protein
MKKRKDSTTAATTDTNAKKQRSAPHRSYSSEFTASSVAKNKHSTKSKKERGSTSNKRVDFLSADALEEHQSHVQAHQYREPAILNLPTSVAPGDNHSICTATTANPFSKRPPSAHGIDAPTVVYVNAYVQSISAVDAVNQSFDADFYVMYLWKDPRIQDDDDIDWGKVTGN